MNVNNLISVINRDDQYRIVQINSKEVRFFYINHRKVITEIEVDLGIGLITSRYFVMPIPGEADVEYAINYIEDVLMSNKDLLNKGEDLYSTFSGISDIIDSVNDEEVSVSREFLEDIFTKYALISMGRSPVYDDIKMNNQKYAGLLILREIMHHLDYKTIMLLKNKPVI